MMITDEMMLYRLFNRFCETHFVTLVSYHSKSSAMTLTSTIENRVRVKVRKFKSIERFILEIAQGKCVRLRFLICTPLKYRHDNFEPAFLLETEEGIVKIIFRNS